MCQGNLLDGESPEALCLVGNLFKGKMPDKKIAGGTSSGRIFCRGMWQQQSGRIGDVGGHVTAAHSSSLQHLDFARQTPRPPPAKDEGSEGVQGPEKAGSAEHGRSSRAATAREQACSRYQYPSSLPGMLMSLLRPPPPRPPTLPNPTSPPAIPRFQLSRLYATSIAIWWMQPNLPCHQVCLQPCAICSC